MGKAKNNGNGRQDESVDRLNQSMAALNQAMATFLVRCADTDARIARIEADRVETERNLAARMIEWERTNNARMAEIDKRFIRIEALLMDHSRILQDHSRILQALPDAVREKIGFKMPEQRPS